MDVGSDHNRVLRRNETKIQEADQTEISKKNGHLKNNEEHRDISKKVATEMAKALRTSRRRHKQDVIVGKMVIDSKEDSVKGNKHDCKEEIETVDGR